MVRPINPILVQDSIDNSELSTWHCEKWRINSPCKIDHVKQITINLIRSSMYPQYLNPPSQRNSHHRLWLPPSSSPSSRPHRRRSPLPYRHNHAKCPLITRSLLTISWPLHPSEINELWYPLRQSRNASKSLNGKRRLIPLKARLLPFSRYWPWVMSWNGLYWGWV